MMECGPTPAPPCVRPSAFAASPRSWPAGAPSSPHDCRGQHGTNNLKAAFGVVKRGRHNRHTSFHHCVLSEFGTHALGCACGIRASCAVKPQSPTVSHCHPGVAHHMFECVCFTARFIKFEHIAACQPITHSPHRPQNPRRRVGALPVAASSSLAAVYSATW